MKHWTTDIFEYGERQDFLYHISEVENGLSCKCICPSCGEKLVAVNHIKQEKPRPHFRHYSNINCDHKTYRETIVHLLSKQIIEEKGFIPLPKVSYFLNTDFASYMTSIDPDNLSNYLPSFIDQKIDLYKLKFDSIKVEKKERQIKPDLQIFKNGNALIVEIAYSHFVDQKKLKKIKDDRLNAIEIDLSHLNMNSSQQDIENEIFNNVYRNVSWLNNEKNEEKLRLKLNQAIEIRHFCFDESKALKTYANMTRIYNCPLKKSITDQKFVLIEKNCKECNFFCGIMEELNIKYEEFKQEEEELMELGEDTSVLYEKYDEKTFYNSGFVNCVAHIENKLLEKITAANKQ